jgi:UDP-N-acetylmuramoyl-tripeptide--D-alanyl-D-alanine ligase
VVLPIDDPDLAALATRCASEGKRVIRVSGAGAAADVTVDPKKGTVTIGTDTVPVTIASVGHSVNVAVAVGIAHALDVPLALMAPRLGALPTAAHRAESQTAPSGALIIDDSYNANPVGAARAVDGGAAMAQKRKGPFIVVTPGMIELGRVQVERNAALAARVKAARAELFVVGYTNRAALVSGHPQAQLFPDRTAAMAAALTRAGASGVILVENDLPDHYA